jgi:hypothetical protein
MQSHSQEPSEAKEKNLHRRIEIETATVSGEKGRMNYAKFIIRSAESIVLITLSVIEDELSNHYTVPGTNS